MMRTVRIRVQWCVRTARPWKPKLNGRTNQGNSVLEIVRRTALLIMELMLMAISRVKEFLRCVRRKLAVLKLWVQLFCLCIYFLAFKLCCLAFCSCICNIWHSLAKSWVCAAFVFMCIDVYSFLGLCFHIFVSFCLLMLSAGSVKC